MPILGQPLIATAQKIAKENWNLWWEDFEFVGDHADIPTLADPYRFCCFCRDYSLMRHNDSRVVETVRCALFRSDEFRNVVRDDKGGALDNLAKLLPKRIPQIKTERSLLSKLSAFARPEEFVAWDRFARCGAHYLAQRHDYPRGQQGDLLRSPRKSPPYRTYADYLRDVHILRDGKAGDEIRHFVGDLGASTNGFVLRVLDCCLMIVGNRWTEKD